ncbi:MAG: hypothetical protein LBO00_02730, partial [Zoogloeaceae bacterium]|nr:hypothetical protein [Zoogloeaceae bacterium]
MKPDGGYNSGVLLPVLVLPIWSLAMRLNQPVTDVETLLPDNEFIYSRTDPKGVIVEANEAFAAIS